MHTLLILFNLFNSNLCTGKDTIDIVCSDVVLTRVIEVFSKKECLQKGVPAVIYVDSSTYHSEVQIERKVGEYNFLIKRFNGLLRNGDFFVSYNQTAFNGLQCKYETKGVSDVTQIISISCLNDEIGAQTIEVIEGIE